MYLVTITLVVSNALISYGDRHSKCCKFGEHLTLINSSYECVEDNNGRLQILTNETDFLNSESSGVCAEVTTDFFIFNISSGKIAGKRPISEKYFPKCCPLNYVYNSVSHTCEEKRKANLSHIKENFVKVGLPNCKVVVDYELNGTTDFEYGLIGAGVKQKRNSLREPGTFCIDENEKGSFTIRECKEGFQICESIRCVRKCCPDGRSFINGSECYDTYTHGLNLSIFSNINKPEGMLCCILFRYFIII